MPKEIIRDQYETTPGVCATIEIGWGRESGHVELGTVVHDSSGQRVAKVTENGMFVQLNRDGINRLIRALRKARDQAYGTDA